MIAVGAQLPLEELELELLLEDEEELPPTVTLKFCVLCAPQLLV